METEESVTSGTLIFSQGDPGDKLYILQSGRVEIFVKEATGEKITLEIIEPDGFFGELALFDGGSRSANAMAIENSTFLALNQEEFESYIGEHPQSVMAIFSVLARRIRQTNQLLRGRVARNPNLQFESKLDWQQRLANFIAQFSGSMLFLYINIFFFLSWILINTDLVPGIEPFDPFPFGLLTMAVSLEAIFLSIFVLLAQNLQSAKDKVRSDIEYEVNLRAELEVAELHEKVDAHTERILERINRLEQSKTK